MYIIEADHVDQALFKGLDCLLNHGSLDESRAGPVMVAPWPVMTVNRNPMNRVLFDPKRDANPVFHLMEALWMLAGRNDARWLDQFVGDFSKRFAEEDGTQHGAYGHRWRKAFGFDQLNAVVERLRKDPKDRQCVIQMWDARPPRCPAGECDAPGCGENDLLATWKDRCCNTHIYLRVHEIDTLPRGVEYNTIGDNRRDVLDLTVCCRSNDAVWGCLSGDTKIQSPEGDIAIASLAKRFDLGLHKFPVYSVDETTGNMALKWCTKAWLTGKKPLRELVFDDGSVLRLTQEHILYLKKTKRGAASVAEEVIIPTKAGDLKIGDRIWAPALRTSSDGYVVFKKNILKGTAYSNLQPTHTAYSELLDGPIPEGVDVHHMNEDTKVNVASNLERLSHSEHMSLHIKTRLAQMTSEERTALAVKGSQAALEWERSLTPEQRLLFKAKFSELMAEVSTRVWSGRSPEERRRITTPGLEAAKKVNTGKKLSKRGKKGLASRWADPEQHRRQSELMRRLNEERRLRSNHKIVAINELPPEPVYDFTVEGYHTALVGNGILAHNCHGANAVHFSVLQEYLAARIGVGIGKLYQLSNNYHVYMDVLEKIWPLSSRGYSSWYGGAASPVTSIVTHPEVFDSDLELFFGPHWETERGYGNTFFHRVAVPLRAAYAAWRSGHRAMAITTVRSVPPSDWSVASHEWFARKLQNAEEKATNGS